MSVSESGADSDPADTMYQRDEVVLDGDRSPGPQNPRPIGHVRRSSDPGYGALRAPNRRTRLTEIEEDHAMDPPSQAHEDRISPPGRMDARQRTGSVRARASFTREPPESRRMNSPLGDGPGRLGASSEQDSETPGSSYYTARSTSGGEAGSERLGGGSELSTATDISPPSYHTMAPTSSGSRRRTYRGT